MKSPIVDVLRRIAGFPEHAETWHDGVAVFSYRDDFALLWGLDGPTTAAAMPSPIHVDGFVKKLEDHRAVLGGGDPKLTIVVVWDGMPRHGDTTVDRFVTPYDWAVVLPRRIRRHGPGASSSRNVGPRIWILDDVHAFRQTAPGGSSIRRLQKSLPWIQDYRVVDHRTGNVVANADFPLSDSVALVEHLQNLSPHATTNAGSGGDGDGALESVLEVWSLSLGRQEDRHSVANLIAPAVLAAEVGALPFLQMSQPERALVVGLRAAGLMPPTSGGSTDAGSGILSSSSGIFRGDGGVKLALVDDRFERGYHHVLATALFGSKYKPSYASADGRVWRYRADQSQNLLTCRDDDGWLVEQLRLLGRPALGDESKPRCFPARDCDILLLDLRFWDERDEEQRNRKIGQWVQVATDCGMASPQPHEPKRGLDAALEVARSRPADPQALALLPLMISRIDPTLPIVLFSSTRQWAVAEMLKERGNVITDFVKPVPDRAGARAGSSLQSADSLKRALKKALDLHEMRVVWERLCALEPENSTRDLGWQGRYGNGAYAQLPECDLGELADIIERFTLSEITIHESLYRPWSFLDNWIRRDSPQQDARLWISPSGRGRLAAALREIGEKMYGYLDPDGFKDGGARSVAVLQFLFLLDFVAGVGRKTDWDPGRPKSSDRRDWTAVRHILGKYGQPENRETFLSAETEAIVQSLCYEGE